MLKTIDELKDLILFAREQKLKSLKIGEIELEISELAHVEQFSGLEMGQSRNSAVTASSSTLVPDNADEDEDLLFHSSRP